MGMLREALDCHARTASEDPKNWGFTGDLGHVRDGLFDLACYMGEMDEAQVQRLLAK